MITILYIFLFYMLIGAVVYLYAQNQTDKELTLFQQELFLLLGFIFKLPIQLIILIDGQLLPYIKYKKTIKYLQIHYGLQIINPFNKTDKNIIRNRRDRMIELLDSVYYNWGGNNEE